jgi:ubiquinone/menaquinone biosynthesis C-methylase UbiE
MNHHDHVNLLRPANFLAGGTWADLGAGSGAFTLALRELVGPTAEIYAVDKNKGSLNQLAQAYRSRFGANGFDHLHLVQADFAKALDLPALDGAVMANSLHYFKDKTGVLNHIRALLKPGGQLVVVEYNVDKGNMWVPYPFSAGKFGDIMLRGGFTKPHLLENTPSSFLHEFYSAVAYRAAADH